MTKKSYKWLWQVLGHAARRANPQALVCALAMVAGSSDACTDPPEGAPRDVTNEWHACLARRSAEGRQKVQAQVQAAPQTTTCTGRCDGAIQATRDLQAGSRDLAREFHSQLEKALDVDKNLAQRIQQLLRNAVPGVAKVSPSDIALYNRLFPNAGSAPPADQIAGIQHPELRDLSGALSDNRKFAEEVMKQEDLFQDRAKDAAKMLEKLEKRAARVSSDKDQKAPLAVGGSRSKDSSSVTRSSGEGANKGRGVALSAGKGETQAASDIQVAAPPGGGEGAIAGAVDAKAAGYGAGEAAADFAGTKLSSFQVDAELKEFKKSLEAKEDPKGLDAFLSFAIENGQGSAAGGTEKETARAEQASSALAERALHDTSLFVRVKKAHDRRVQRMHMEKPY